MSSIGARRILPFLLASLFSGSLAGCAFLKREPPPAPAVDDVLVVFDERLGVDDVFEIRVVGESDLSGSYRVGSDGTIDFPYIGRVQVLGLRPNELQEEVTRRLRAGYYRNPQVAVLVKEWNSRKLVVLGKVQKPGPVSYFPKMTIVDAIAAAGGFADTAAKNSVRLRREQKGKVETRSYPVADISEGRFPNVVMLPGDVIVVDERLF
jgi:protein involved in polysaccharide export with SLBB domain